MGLGILDAADGCGAECSPGKGLWSTLPAVPSQKVIPGGTNVFEDLGRYSTAEIFPLMTWDGCRPAVGVPSECLKYVCDPLVRTGVNPRLSRKATITSEDRVGILVMTDYAPTST